MKYAIETFDLKKQYKNFIAVNSINMKIPNKTIFGMLGPNGAGKTTTIKMLTCLAQPTSGTAVVGGYDVKDNPDEVRELLGMVPQQVSLYKDLTVKENAELCADYYGVPKDEKFDRIDDLMELVDIKYAQNKRIGQLSGGQKQKASLVASLVHRPEILFLDEPTIGLDPTTKRVLWDLIRELNDNGHTIILCSHDMHEVDMLCDNVGIINTGNLVAYDTPQGLKDSLLKEQKLEYEENIKTTLSKIYEETSQLDETKNLNEDSDLKENSNLEENTNNSSSKWANKERDSKLVKELHLREMSFLLKNINENIIDSIMKNPNVYSIDIMKDERITLKIENFNENVITDVLRDVINNGGLIESIYTQEPSLEDVFMKATAEVDENARA
ncbi:MAG: ATP-binding cassette domain-containing protein [archaeon]|nr:ATP-binding cassette domain-containing protein [archaeon]